MDTKTSNQNHHPTTLISSNNNNNTVDDDQLFYIKDNVEMSDELKLKLHSVREKFLEHYRNDPKLFSESDIDLVKSNDWWTLRFIKWNKSNEDKALQQMLTAFKWRKSFGLNDRSSRDLPIEFAQAAAIFPLGNDYLGRPVMYIRVKVHKKIQALEECFQQFMAGLINYVDHMAGPHGFTLVLDFTGMGWANVDMEIFQFLIRLVQSYFPYGLRRTICMNFPKILRPIRSIVRVLIGSSAEKTIRFCEGDEILKYIAPKHVPKYLGGDCDVDFRKHEELKDQPSVRDLAGKYGFTQKDVDKYLKMFEPSILEAEKLVKGERIR